MKEIKILVLKGKSWFFSLMILCTSMILHAQYIQEVDNLEIALKLADNPDQKIEILLKLSNKFNNIDPHKALSYAKEAYYSSLENDNDNNILNSMLCIARNYWSITDYKNAMQYAVKSEELAKELNSPQDLSLSQYIIGIIYLELDDYNKTAEYFFKSLKLSEQIGDKEAIGRIYNGIGSVNSKQKNYNKALEYYLKSLHIAEEIKDSIGIARGLNNIAAAYANKEDYIRARDYTEKALRMNKELMNRKSEGINCLNLGDIYLKLKDYGAAYDNLQKALQFYEDLNNTLFIATCWVSLGNYFMEINELDQSKKYVTKAFNVGKKYGYKTIIYNSAELLSKICLINSDTLNSLKYEIIKYQMNDSLNIERNNTELTRMEMKYEFNKKEQEKKIEQQRKDFITLIIFICLTLGFIVIALFFARQKVKIKNARLENEKIELELVSRNKEFTTNVMCLMKKNEMLSDISEKLVQLEENTVSEETKDALQKIANELQQCKDKDVWQEFELRFNQVHSDFYKKLSHQFPTLTSNDLRLCAFLKLNMSSKEISEITGQRIGTLEMARSRLRKKFGISKTQIDLITFLSDI